MQRGIFTELVAVNRFRPEHPDCCRAIRPRRVAPLPRSGRGASALGEIPLLLWLLVVGVNVQRWNEQASAAEEWRHF